MFSSEFRGILKSSFFIEQVWATASKLGPTFWKIPIEQISRRNLHKIEKKENYETNIWLSTSLLLYVSLTNVGFLFAKMQS